MHVNKRLKSRSKIQLPVQALLALFQDPGATPFVTVSKMSIHLYYHVKSKHTEGDISMPLIRHNKVQIFHRFFDW